MTTLVYFLFVETRGPTLEEIAKIFDGDNAQVGHVDMEVLEEKTAAVQVENVRAEEKV